MTRLPPCVTLGLAPSFGFGDRIGLATPGHVEAMKRSGSGIQPIFPQQSIREMTRTGRSPGQVIHDAMQGAQSVGWTGPSGADADHLKTPEDVDVTAAAGFTFFTIDPSDEVDQQADDYEEATIREKFEVVRGCVPWFESYLGRRIKLSTGSSVEFSDEACLRAAVKYGRAIRRALDLATHIRRVNESAGRDYEIELSVDETDQPTTLVEHTIIADQCLQSGMKLVSLAPRFIGELRKGCRLQGRLDHAGGFAQRSRRDRPAAGSVQAESALRIRQALDVSCPRPGDEGPFSCQDGRHELPRSAPRSGPTRRITIPANRAVRA